MPRGRSCPAHVVDLYHVLKPGDDVVIEMDYEATLFDVEDQVGLWRSAPFLQPDGSLSPSVLLTTQLEEEHARALFPSFDDPAIKATFQLTVTAPQQYTLLSNTPPATTTTAAGGGKIVQFQKTPKMSTYLLSLAAGDLTSKKRMTTTLSPNVEIGVWAVPSEWLHLGSHAHAHMCGRRTPLRA